MTVRWSNQEDITNWVPSTSSTSGETVLTDGTKIVGAVRSRNAIKRWPVTVYESSRFITVNAPKDPWTITRKSSNE